MSTADATVGAHAPHVGGSRLFRVKSANSTFVSKGATMNIHEFSAWLTRYEQGAPGILERLIVSDNEDGTSYIRGHRSPVDPRRMSQVPLTVGCSSRSISLTAIQVLDTKGRANLSLTKKEHTYCVEWVNGT
jgi:hypothetical protein